LPVPVNLPANVQLTAKHKSIKKKPSIKFTLVLWHAFG